MAEAQRFPVDFDALDKGSVVGVDVLVEVLGVPASSAFYSGRQVDLCWKIERELQVRGKNVLAACVKDEIHILDDPAASIHAQKLARKSLKRFRRAHRKMLEVDAGKLDAGERKDHDRAIVVQGAILAGIGLAKREIQAVIHERKTPGLPKPPE